MQKDFIDSLGKFNEASLETAKRLGEIQLRAFERLTEQQLAMATDCLAGGLKQFESVNEPRDARAVASEQSKAATDMNEKMAEHARKTMEIMGDVRDELTDWAKTGMEKAGTFTPVVPMMPVAPTAKPAAKKSA